ncbi:glycosyltransferase [Rhodohalobacter sp. 8-1]|uniref:glycosyltransferase n=1 Tax=Rhodohalobacter sp. 8-1 TaxID=3131972 RepID=UPI0030ED26AF
MKIVDVAEFYTDTGGGVKTYINQKLQAAKRLGHEMVVIAPGTEAGEEERFGGRILWVKGPKLILDPNYVVLWRKSEVHRLLDILQPDVVEGSSVWTGGHFAGTWEGDAVKSLVFHQDPVAVYPQTFLNSFISLKKLDKLFGFAWNYIGKVSRMYDTTIVSGDWLNERLQRFGVHNPTTIRFGINKSFFSPQRRDPELRKKLLKELGLDEDASLCISVSRFHPEKRVGTIIDGFQKASQNRPMGLIIFGGGPFEKWVAYKSSRVDNVRLMGFTSDRDELANIMASSDYFLHGSAAETFGIVVAEAICSGLPVVVPDRGGAMDFGNPDYSEVYKTGDSDEMADAIIRIVNRERSLLLEACKVASQNYVRSVDDHFDELFSYYEFLVNNRE